jgi:hypothetical protein
VLRSIHKTDTLKGGHRTATRSLDTHPHCAAAPSRAEVTTHAHMTLRIDSRCSVSTLQGVRVVSKWCHCGWVRRIANAALARPGIHLQSLIALNNLMKQSADSEAPFFSGGLPDVCAS